MPRVSSSHLRHVKYDEDTSELTIRFHDGSVYTYLDVDENEYSAILAAKSKGKQFWGTIRDEKITIKDKAGKRKN